MGSEIVQGSVRIATLPHERYRATPLFWVESDTELQGYELGDTTTRGAAIMVELVSFGKVVGHVCISLVGKGRVSRRHIARSVLE